ncbi:MAG: hypothetical protein HYR63_04620 [Proteobacteria bacterium]|nr:hypothetical protein [Pseudomonadota bacterium]MBI3496678.1 hypothetical protein [Pseudomonadota bacterium]
MNQLKLRLSGRDVHDVFGKGHVRQSLYECFSVCIQSVAVAQLFSFGASRSARGKVSTSFILMQRSSLVAHAVERRHAAAEIAALMTESPFKKDGERE